MKNAIAIIVSMLLVFSFAGPTFARMGMSRAMDDMPDKERTGVIEAVDLKAKTITIKGMRGPVTVTTDEKTVVTMGNVIKTLADLKVGDKVSIAFEVAEGRNIAKTILVFPAAVAPTEKKVEPNPDAKSEPKTEEKK